MQNLNIYVRDKAMIIFDRNDKNNMMLSLKVMNTSKYSLHRFQLKNSHHSMGLFARFYGVDFIYSVLSSSQYNKKVKTKNNLLKIMRNQVWLQSNYN